LGDGTGREATLAERYCAQDVSALALAMVIVIEHADQRADMEPNAAGHHRAPRASTGARAGEGAAARRYPVS
jgi:hypothetical protein